MSVKININVGKTDNGMSKKRMSIMMLTSRYRKTGGHESVINSLSTQLQNAGYDVSIGAYSFEMDPPKNISKVKLSRFGGPINKSSFKDKDIVHSHQTQMNYYALFVDKPFIFHYHGISDLIQRLNVKFSFAILKGRISKTIAVSQSANDDLQKIVGLIPSQVVYSGVDTTLFKPNQDERYRKGEPQLLFVGNLFHYKNVLCLIKMMPEFLRKYPRAHLAIVGDGKQYDEIETMIRHKGLSESIHLFGQIPHHKLSPYYSSCDVYISASLRETFDLPALEAMASGKPVALSDIPSHREIVTKSKAGNVFSPLNRRNIVDCIDNVYLNKTPFGRSAHNFAIPLNWSTVAENISRIYDQAIGLNRMQP